MQIGSIALHNMVAHLGNKKEERENHENVLKILNNKCIPIIQDSKKRKERENHLEN